MGELIEKLAEILEVEEIDVTKKLTDFDEWDSLSKLALIAEARQKFNLMLKTDTIRGFVTVKDICDYLG